MKKDQLYSGNGTPQGEFRFDSKVAEVFPDMILRSVPGYEIMLDMIGVITQRFAVPGTNCYDLGCSLGASTLAMLKHLPGAGCRVFAIDNSPSMLEVAEKNFAAAGYEKGQVDAICADAAQTGIYNASIVIMNLTLQFIRPEIRETLLKNIFDGMVKGGVLVLSEKIVSQDNSANERLISLHHEFKRIREYSDLEISRKRDAIENYLLPESEETHVQRLQAAGFASIDRWFQCFNFVSLLAIK